MEADPDLLSGDALKNPYPVLAELREDDPVRWSERQRGWLILGYEEVSAAHHDDAFSSNRIEPTLRKLEADGGDERLIATLRVLSGWMVFKEGDAHRRLRHLMQRSFTPRVVKQMHDQVLAICDELIDGLSGDAPDLVDQLAGPLPAAVIAEMFGAPVADRDRFRQWSEDIVSLVFGARGTEDRHERAITGMAELVAYLDALIAERRAEPREGDLLSLLLQSDEDGDVLTADEITAMSTLLLFGGSETTTNLIGSGLLALMRNPAQRDALLADPELRAPAIEELLRFDGPARASMRLIGHDCEVGGHAMKAGDRAYLMLAAANRDPSRFSSPNELELARDPNQHLGFGVGRHYCLGASLARLEGQIVIPHVLERLGDIQPVTDDLDYNPYFLSRSLRALPVKIPARA